MDIFLEKEILQDIDRASEIEWIEKNDFGFYSSSSCIGMNTRREHGLFVTPDISQKKKVVLLSKLEESIFIDNKLHEISTNQYNTGVFPSGYKYLKKFNMNPFPRYTFDVEGRIIEKTIFLMSKYPLLIIRYELKNKGVPINMIIKPFIAERFATDVNKELQGLNTDSYIGSNFVRWAIKPNMPEVYVYFSAGDFNPANLWYKNFIYPKDVGKYSDSLNEDLFNPGFFQATIGPYQTLDLYVSTKELDIDNLDYESFYRSERDSRKGKSGIFQKEDTYARMNQSLKKSIKIFDQKPLVTISSLDNVFTTRDVIFSLPALFLINKEYDDFKIHFKSLFYQVTDGLLPVHSPLMREKNHTSAADLSLWLINLSYTYFSLSKDKEFFDNEIMDGFQSIIDSYLKGTLHNIHSGKDNLIFCGDKKTSTSWIPLTDNDKVLRYGKLLEINALWYNAVMIFAKLNEVIGKNRKSTKYRKLAEKINTAFSEAFVNDDGSLVDFINDDAKNNDFRINQLIPLTLPFSPVDTEIAKLVLNQIERDLLTPYGLRSSKIKKGIDDKVLHRKSPAYFNGAVWPWTIGLYVDAALKYSDNKEQKAQKLKKYFNPIVDLIDSGLINYLPEVLSYNGKPVQKGIADYTTSLSGFIWGCFLLNKEINVKEG